MNIYFWGANASIISSIKTCFDYESVYSDEKIYYWNVMDVSEINNDVYDAQICYCVPESVQNNMNGIEFAESLRRHNKYIGIIFISHNLLSVSSILRRYICPLGYFLFDEIKSSVKLLNAFKGNNLRTDNNLLMEFTSQYSKIYVDSEHITYFMACNKKIICNTDNNKNFEFYDTISNLEKKYGDLFIRCHSGYLINKNKIEDINIAGNYILIKNTYEKIPISRKYKGIIKQYALENQKVYFV